MVLVVVQHDTFLTIGLVIGRAFESLRLLEGLQSELPAEDLGELKALVWARVKRNRGMQVMYIVDYVVVQSARGKVAGILQSF